MDHATLIDLKERIAIAESFSPQERDFILAAINAAVDKPAVTVHAPPNYLGRIEQLWAALSIDDGGEGLCAAPIGGMTLPLIAADRKRLNDIIPIARRMANMFGKPVRLVKFSKREDVELYRADGMGAGK